MKKVLSIILAVAMFLSIFSMVTFAAVDINIVQSYTFSTGTEGWGVFGTSNALTYDSEGKYVSLSNDGKSWVSPAINIYDIIKENGAGTYTVNAKVMHKFDPQAKVSARLLLRTDKEYSFSASHTNGYYRGIGIKTEFDPYTWSNLSGSFKVLPSDITGETGQFLLCFDELFADAVSDFCIDSIKICKLDETDISNGDFYYNEVGWRNWGGSGNFEIVTTGLNINLSFLCANYIKASTYGSIATNVDQIIANYGCTKYDLSFKVKVPDEAYENLSQFVVFLSTDDGSYNHWVTAVQKDDLDNEWWLTVKATVDMSKIISGAQTLYDVLSPQTNQVLLRFEFRTLDGTTYADDQSYFITDVSFKLKPYVASVQFEDPTIVVERGWEGRVAYSVTGNEFAEQGVRWESSNENILTVDSISGYIITKNAGAALVNAVSKENGRVYASCLVTVTPCKQAVILLHGRIDDTGNVFGAYSNIVGHNNEYSSNIDAEASEIDDLSYTSVSAQSITGINENGHVEGGNLAHYLTETLGYEENVNLFAFNYPNEDAVIHSAMKFKVYIDNLIDYVRNSGNTELKYAFYEDSEAYANNEYTFSIVAHSMGGLVARYYIENCTNINHYGADSHANGACQYNDDHVSKLITIDTPHWGSELADLSCSMSAAELLNEELHELCDHDLQTESGMFGNETTFLCIFGCGGWLRDYLTDTLNYQRERSTAYYAIAGINEIGGEDNVMAEIDADIFDATSLEFEIYNKHGFIIFSSVADDNIVSLYSQIGWGDVVNGIARKKINFEKIAINIDGNDGNDMWNHFHSKMPHRDAVTQKVGEFLWD